LHIKPFLGHHKLCDLTPGTVTSFRNVLARRGRSRALAGKVVSSLGSILAEAMANVRLARNVVAEQARHDRRRARVEKRLHRAARLRLRGLTWEAVDLERKILTVRQRADRWNTIGSPKSDAGKREVPSVVVAISAHRP
jgi:integrase